MATNTCSICRSAKPTVRIPGDQTAAFCPGCVRGHLLPSIVKELGAEEVQRLVGAVAAGEQSRAGSKLDRLIAGQRGPASLPTGRPLEFSTGTGTPARTAKPSRPAPLPQARYYLSLAGEAIRAGRTG